MQREFVIICAMPNELLPVLDLAWAKRVLALSEAKSAEIKAEFEQWHWPKPAITKAGLPFYEIELGGVSGWAVLSGIGIANAAAATALAAELSGAKRIIYTGTSGGLARDSVVGEVVIGSAYAYHNVDVTALGCAPGQMVGMPEKYLLSAAWHRIVDQFLSTSEFSLTSLNLDPKITKGLILSGDSFITANNVTTIRNTFPQAVATDMESAAGAQIAWKLGRDFISVRCISDLCSPEGEEVFKLNLYTASATAALITRTLVASGCDAV